MVRKFIRVAAVCAVVLCARLALADENVPVPPKIPASAEPPASADGAPPSRGNGDHPGRGGDWREVSRFVDSLPPELRESVRQHFQEWMKKRGALHSKPGPDSEEAKKFLERLTPAQRDKFKENFQRWQNMPPEEREMIRVREEFRQRQAHQEVEKLLQESGLTLDGGKREEFTRRYAQERRKIEEKLQSEMAEKRGPQVKELADRLKAEFSAPK